MKEYNIEAYLDGTLSDIERIEFEKELNSNSEFALEVENYKTIREDLETIALRKKIKSALSQDIQVKQSNFSIRKMMLFLLLCLIGVFVFLNWFRQSVNDQETIPLQEQIKEKPNNKEPIKPVKKEEVPLQEKIKKDEKAEEHIYIAQDIKRENPKENQSTEELRGTTLKSSEWKLFLDSIWYSEYVNIDLPENSKLNKIDALLKEGDFPKAYARIQLQERRALNNDTLFIMKGYCLLEMKRGPEALKNLDQIKEPAWSQHIQWYNILGHLLSNDNEKAEGILDQISNTPSHYFYNHAIKKQEELRIIYKE